MVSTFTRLPLLSVPLFIAVGVAESEAAGILWAVLCLALSGGASTLYLEYLDRKSKRLNSSHSGESRMPSSA